MPHLLLLAEAGAEEICLFNSPLCLHPAMWHLINFILFAALIIWAFPKVLRSLNAHPAQKHAELKKELEASAKLRSEMEQKFLEYEERLKSIDEQVARVVDEAREEAQSEKERLIKEAEETAVRMKEDAKAIADQEVERAKRELTEETMALAARAAEDALRNQITDDDHNRLAEEFIDKLGNGEAS